MKEEKEEEAKKKTRRRRSRSNEKHRQQVGQRSIYKVEELIHPDTNIGKKLIFSR